MARGSVAFSEAYELTVGVAVSYVRKRGAEPRVRGVGVVDAAPEHRHHQWWDGHGWFEQPDIGHMLEPTRQLLLYERNQARSG